jgi:hypothetical protein
MNSERYIGLRYIQDTVDAKKMYLDLKEIEVQISNQPLYRWGYLALGTVDVQCET